MCGIDNNLEDCIMGHVRSAYSTASSSVGPAACMSYNAQPWSAAVLSGSVPPACPEGAVHHDRLQQHPPQHYWGSITKQDQVSPKVMCLLLRP